MMTKEERQQAHKDAKVILRGQFVPSKNKWIISFLTPRGGWSRFSSDWYESKEAAGLKIDEIVQKYPETYIIE